MIWGAEVKIENEFIFPRDSLSKFFLLEKGQPLMVVL